jgi:hypothetical protein
LPNFQHSGSKRLPHPFRSCRLRNNPLKHQGKLHILMKQTLGGMPQLMSPQQPAKKPESVFLQPVLL